MLTVQDASAAPGFESCSRLAAMPGIRHAFFTRQGGVSDGLYGSLNAGLGSGDERTKVVENRARMSAHLGASHAEIASPFQVHSAEAAITHRIWDAERPEVDGVVTNTPGVAIGVVTADCGPVLFADPGAGVIGAAHAGWKGALTGVLEATVAKMEALGARRENITATLGPTIGRENYEVGNDFRDRFIAAAEENRRFFRPSDRDGHAMFDLPAYIVERMQAAGVRAGDLGICTYEDPDRFFSYRRTTHLGEPDYGRQMSAIVLER